MESILHSLDNLKQHWNTLALVITWVGIVVVYLRRRANWRRKQFMNQVNFSLNYVIGQSLAMRTLLETTTQEVWLNEYGVKMVSDAAHKATIEHPFIVLENAEDQEFINRAVLNVLSERFAETFVAAALNVPVKTGTFCFAITCEKYEEIRTVKLRVLLIEERTLTELFGSGGKGEQLQVSNQVNRARLKTLKAIHDLHVKDAASAKPVLGHLELGVTT